MQCIFIPSAPHAQHASTTRQHKRTSSLLLAIASNSPEHGVLAPANAVLDALDVALGLRGVVLGLALGVLLLPGLLPGGRAGQVANRLYDVALGGVPLAGGLAANAREGRTSVRVLGANDGEKDVLGALLVAERHGSREVWWR